MEQSQGSVCEALHRGVAAKIEPQVQTVGFTAQGIGQHISLAKGVINIHVEVGYCLEPSLLADI